MAHLQELGFKEDGSFRFNLPAIFKKSQDGTIQIEGVASVETPDLTGETVIAKGMDLNYLVKRGYFNDNHDRATDAKVGVPTEAKIIKEGGVHKLFVKGYMLDTPRAKGIVELAEALQKSNSSRQLGFSIEGKTRQRDGKLITRSWVKDIAITAEPIHPETYLNIVKSISAQIAENGYIDENGISKSIGADGTEFWAKLGDIVTGSVAREFENLKKSLPNHTEKSLAAGCDNPPATGGGALRKQSLEDGLTNEDIPQEEAEKAKKKTVTKSQAIELIQARGYSPAIAAKMADLLFSDRMKQLLH